MYPYLSHIAHENHIKDPFDEKVVEAYWIGNGLLETIEKKRFYQHLVDDHKIPKKLDRKSFGLIEDKLGRGAMPHHSFHVLDIWKRTGHNQKAHTLESMDKCRISWGDVTEVAGPYITVRIEPLCYKDKKLFLGEPVVRKLIRRLEAEYDIEQLKVGDIVSVHWDTPCEIITKEQAEALRKYTNLHIKLANETL
jgi:hypothetical protein